MGEIFPAEKPAEALEFTGERLTSAAHGQVEIEHFHRYFLARDLCRGKDVLDIASGEGYGSALLAQVARSVVGVEIVPAIAAHAARSYPRRNLRFVAGDARAIPLRDGAVDVVVSFETIEHLYEHDRFVAEIKRVLRPGGVAIVSTPERDVCSPANAPANPYHLRELTKAEFLCLLSSTFACVRSLAQRPMHGSAMLLDDAGAGEGSRALTFERRGDGHFEANCGLPRNPYIVAVAADHRVPLPHTSLYVETSHLDLRDLERAQQARREAEAQAQRQADAVKEVEREWLERQSEWQRTLSEALFERDQAEAARRAAERELERVVGSTVWRMTGPLRRIGGRLPPGARQQLRRAGRVLWWTATLQLPARLRERRRLRALAAPKPVATPVLSPILAGALPDLGALRVFRIPQAERRRLTLVTDSISPGSLYGGVATAILLSAILARRLDARLRIVTETQRGDPGAIATVLRAHACDYDEEIDLVFSDRRDGDRRRAIEVGDDELFLTTSWWTTANTLQAISPRQVFYLIQEDERMFYPQGDALLRASEVLARSDLRFIVNSRLMWDHFAATGLDNIVRRGVCFEPAFPRSSYYWEPSPGKERLDFLFYARPQNFRNLFLRGLEAVNAAIERDILPPERWRLTFIGRQLGPVTLARGAVPALIENLPLDRYAALVRRTDLGLALMYTPHPSYLPLDIAASGGVAVTNRYGPKRSLARYSESILCVDLDLEALVAGIAEGAALAADRDARLRNYENAGLGRSWQEAFAPVVKFVAAACAAGG